MTNRGVVNEVVLGFMEDAKNNHNRLIMKLEFTPRKVGGRPGWVALKGLPELMVCEVRLQIEPSDAAVHQHRRISHG